MSASLLPRFSEPGSPPRLSASRLDSRRALTPLSLLLLGTTCSWAPPAPPLLCGFVQRRVRGGLQFPGSVCCLATRKEHLL